MHQCQRLVSLLVIALLSFTSLEGATIEGQNSKLICSSVVSSTSKESSVVEAAIGRTASYLQRVNKAPICGSIGGEWVIIGLARSESSVASKYYENYYEQVKKQLKAQKGVLSESRYTDYSRVILALTALGKDVTNVGGYNLLSKLSDWQAVKKQGLNGVIFALIALDSHGYQTNKLANKEQTTRTKIIDYIISKEMVSAAGVRGGFALTGKVADPDLTAMALTALAPYKDKAEVKSVIDRGIKALVHMQLEHGGYASYGTQNLESTAQVIVACSALGIDVMKDERFKKLKTSLVNEMLQYELSSGGFKHILEGKVDEMATEQAMYALVAYSRFSKGKTSLYHMTDVTIKR